MEPSAADPWDIVVAAYRGGDVVCGTVTRLIPGSSVVHDVAHVDLSGVSGIIPASAVPWLSHRSLLPRVGDRVYCQVAGIDPETHTAVLGGPLVQWEEWLAALPRYEPGTRHHGRAVHVTVSGVYVELEPGIEGLIPTDQQAGRTFTPGEAVDVVIISVRRVPPDVRLALT